MAGSVAGVSPDLILSAEPDINLRLNLCPSSAAFIRSYYGGLLIRGSWRYTRLEAVVLHFVAVDWKPPDSDRWQPSVPLLGNVQTSFCASRCHAQAE